MKGDTVLDYIEFQLSSPRSSRCELFISAEGETEKLASGFLKPFLAHVRAAQEQHAEGSQATIRLEGPPVCSNGSSRPWFTKGTLERFVRFVSTPEVLERVKTVEDELAQLEQVRSIQASSLTQIEDAILETNPTFSRADVMPVSVPLGQYQYEAINNEAEASKRELLRAMDVRLFALQQEQNMALCRAAAAGFDGDSMEDLLAFCNFFGAERLRAACVWFLELSIKGQRAIAKSIQPGFQETLSQSNGLLSNVNGEAEAGSFLKASRENLSSDRQCARGWTADVGAVLPSGIVISPTQLNSDELVSISPDRCSQLQGNVSKGFPQRTSPRRRSASPLKKVQVGRFGSRRSGSVVVRSIDYFSSHEHPSKERDSSMESSSSDSEEHVKSHHGDEPAPAPAIMASPLPARILGVQAAISLFESKQHKEPSEAPAKQRPVKQESRRGSLEGENASSFAKVEPRQYGQLDGHEVSTLRLQESAVPYHLLGSECVSSEAMHSRVGLMSNDQGKALLESHYKPWMEQITAGSSSRKSQEPSSYSASTGLSSELDSEELLCYQQMVGDASHTISKGDRPQEFLWQMKMSSTREALKKDFSTTEGFVESELETIGASPLARRKYAVYEPVDSDLSSARSTVTSVSRGGTMERSSESRQYPPTPTGSAMTISSTVTHNQINQGQRSWKSFEQHPSLVEEGPSTHIKEECSIDSKDTGNTGRESLRSSWIVPSDVSIQALASMVDHPVVDDEFSGRHAGRFYEQYRKLRDAKMMEEQHSKRAEREAKLRLMEETLELRKAEMDARTAKLSKESNHAQARAAKLLALKANLSHMQKVQEDGDEDQGMDFGLVLQAQDCTISDSSPPSPPLTPRAAKEQALTPKPHRVKKAAATSQKSATTPRSSTRAASVSPRSTPRGTVGRVSSHRPSVSSSTADNPLACSVPCFSDLKKENTNPSLRKSAGSARVHPKNGGASGHPQGTSRASPLESNGSVSVQNNRTARLDRKNRVSHTRQSYATGELKVTSTEDEEGIPVSLKGQRVAKIETPVLSKIRRSAVAPIQEVKPFLRKGSGIGPGAGPGVMKLKAFSSADAAAKSSDDDTPATPLKNSDEESPTTARLITETSDGDNMTGEESAAKNPADLYVQETGEKEAEADAGGMLDADSTHHSADGLFSMREEEEKPNTPSKDEEMLENERACHTISFPIDFGTHERYAASFVAKLDSNSNSQQSHMKVTRCEGEDSATLSQLLAEDGSQLLQSETSATGSASFRANLLSDERIASRFSPMVAASPARSSAKRLDAAVPEYFSPSSVAAAVESPLGSPASWNSSQVQYASETDATRHKKWGGSSQKPVVVVVPPKEPAKGLKRLLKFARKSRAAPEVIIMDGVSASTTSEGDDDFEEAKEVSSHFAHDLLRKTRLQERRLKDLGNAVLSGDQGSTHDKGLVQSLRSTIPIPPSNFKLRDDHVAGSTRPKAPRSFFSLSTFRSRGSEGKSR